MFVDFTGKVVSKQGETIFERVAGQFEMRSSGSFHEWDGFLTITSGEDPDMFHGFIVTDDGGRGEAFATHVRWAEPNSITFQGIGRPPLPVD